MSASETNPGTGNNPWWKPMSGRAENEEHRTSTPLELLFDLSFVVAVSQAALHLHHALTTPHTHTHTPLTDLDHLDHLGQGIAGYAMVFFAIWWAWMNFTWFASSYDTDDVPYRLLTLLQMTGVLILAAGVQDAFTHYDFTLVTWGYVVMRLAMVTQWLRAAAQDPAHRGVTLRYATGITLLQAGWLLRLTLPHPADYAAFAVLAAAEMCVPLWAEHSGRPTPWHPGHIAERYGLFTIIVLGEVLLGTLTAIRSALTTGGLSPHLLQTAAGGLLLVFTLWWWYFSGPETRLPTLRTALLWGYGHYLLFAATAALGAGLEAVVGTLEDHTTLSPVAAAMTVAVPAALYLLVLAPLHRLSHSGGTGGPTIATTGAAALLALAACARQLTLPGSILAMGAATALTLATGLALTEHRTHRTGRQTGKADGTPDTGHPPPPQRADTTADADNGRKTRRKNRQGKEGQEGKRR